MLVIALLKYALRLTESRIRDVISLVGSGAKYLFVCLTPGQSASTWLPQVRDEACTRRILLGPDENNLKRKLYGEGN